jgi:glycine betaine/proline transport system ATP-binding protein
VGTPEEVGGAPADDYVADFVANVPRTTVLTVTWLMRPPRPEEPLDGPETRSGTVVRDILPMLAAGDAPVRVLGEDGVLLGVVGRTDVLRAIAEEHGSPGAALSAAGEG